VTAFVVSRSPRVTNILLIATLVVTGVAVWQVMLAGPLGAGAAARYLALFSVLFLARVAGQVLVVRRAPAWLPRMEGDNWNLVPYRILLPAQLAILLLMVAIIAGVATRRAPFGVEHSGFGRLLLYASCLYATVMALRYVVRMARKPAERWFGGAIPIVFHMVLAAFLFTWGRFHVSR
jgi:hypothetical protein